MAERIVDRARVVIQPIVEDMGYTFVDLEYKKDYTGYVLALTIDKPEGVNINDCEAVSRALDIPLDENDLTNGKPYNFNVSSYGLDRAFRNEYDFNKHLGKLVDIKFYAPFNGKKIIVDTLEDFDDDSITIQNLGNNLKIDKKLIAQICAHLEF
jgi:ribosome maturation factor RimP